MAIKGKGKAKRRGVASAPKPMYVKPKTPLLARRGFWITILSVVVAGAIAGFLTGFLIQRHNDKVEAERKAEAGVLTDFGDQLEATLSGLGRPLENQFIPFPNMNTDAGTLTSGDLSAKEALANAEGYASDAAKAVKTIKGISIATLIEGHADLTPLADVKNLLVQAMTVYGQAANSLKLAAGAEGAEQKDLASQTSTLYVSAQELFNQGWQKLINLRLEFNLINPVITAPATPGTTASLTIPPSGGGGNKKPGGKNHK
jgi:hypothetical protein